MIISSLEMGSALGAGLLSETTMENLKDLPVEKLIVSFLVQD